MGDTTRLFEQYSTTPLYNTKLVVSKTGVPADTFRAWERRYGLPKPYRDENQQRLYSEQDIALIRWLRDRKAEGLTISQAIALLEADEAPASTTEQPRSFEALRNDLIQVLLHFDAPTSDKLLSEAFALYSLDAVCMNIIEPALVEIGEMWHAGEASVAQEHFSSQFLRRKLLALFNIYDIPDGSATVVAACAPSEQHDLGLLMLSLLLVRRNFRVVYLGSDVPIDALQQAVAQVRPRIVCISAATPATANHALQSAHQLRASAPELLIFIGGQGLENNHGSSDGIHLLNSNGVEATEEIRFTLASKRTISDSE
jgi:DNA-binding transcriptional MerR regulator